MNQESKLIIFGRYLGQNVYVKTSLPPYYGAGIMNSSCLTRSNLSYGQLLLTPLSSITEEHLNALSDVTGSIYAEYYVQHLNGENPLHKISGLLSIEAYQYLQQLGYALPQTVIEDGKSVTYSVEKLVELDIFKLKYS